MNMINNDVYVINKIVNNNESFLFFKLMYFLIPSNKKIIINDKVNDTNILMVNSLLKNVRNKDIPKPNIPIVNKYLILFLV